MKTKAAVAYAAGKQLEVVTVDLDGPKAGDLDRGRNRDRMGGLWAS